LHKQWYIIGINKVDFLFGSSQAGFGDDAIMDGHVHGVVAYLGLKTKSVKGEKPMTIEGMKQLEELKAIVKPQAQFDLKQALSEGLLTATVILVHLAFVH
jgi:hypothetical protein